jgi:cytidine deaminase
MNSEAIFNAAHTTAIKLLESGAFVTPSDTVCALQTSSGRIYTGISRTVMNNSVHAEIDAVRNMLAAGENIIIGLLLISTQMRTPMLPCNNCLGYILSLAQENIGCMVMLQDRMISINEVGMFAAPMGGMMDNPNFVGHTPVQPQFTSAHAAVPPPAPPPLAPSPPLPVQPAVNTAPAPVTPQPADDIQETDITTKTETSTANTENATGDLLKNKVNSLLRSVDDDTDEFLDSLPTKKKRFGFFRK